MKNTLTAAPWIALVLVLIYFTQCQKQKQPIVINKIDTVYHVDSFPVEGKTVYSPSPYEVVEHDTVFGDTVYVLSEYATENRYTIPIRDSIGTLDIDLSIQYNSLQKYSYTGQYKTYAKTITDTKYVITPKLNKLLVGLVLSGNAEYFGASPVVGVKTKKDNVFLAGYDVINKNYSFGYMVKIGRK